MATTETLEQALQSLIEDTKRSREQYLEDTKRSRERADSRFEQMEQSWSRLDQAMASLAAQSERTQLKLDTLAEQTRWELADLAKQTRWELADLAKQVKQTTQQMGEQAQRMGTLVEDMVSPDMLRILRRVVAVPEEVPGVVNVRVKEFYHGKELNGHAQTIEVDAIARCGEYVLVNETKTTFKVKHVDAFLKKLGQLRDYFPEFVGRQIFGVISSLRIDPSVVTRASRQGLLVLSLGEGMMELQNEVGFKPKLF